MYKSVDSGQTYKVGQTVPYINTKKNIKNCVINGFKLVENGKIWFTGIDTVTGASVFYPEHKSLTL